MKVIVIQKGSFNVTQLEGVSSIIYSAGIVTINYGTDSNVSYAFSDYMFQIIA